MDVLTNPENIVEQVRAGEMDLKEARILIRLMKQDDVLFRTKGGTDEKAARREVRAKYAGIDGKLREASQEATRKAAASASRFMANVRRMKARGLGACMPRHSQVMREVLGNGR